MIDRPIYVLVLRPDSGVDAIRALRAGLKILGPDAAPRRLRRALRLRRIGVVIDACSDFATAVCGSTITFAPICTRCRSITSSFARRMHPLDTCPPIVEGAFVPWMRYCVPAIYIARAPSGFPAAGGHARQIRLARNHLGRWIPVRPLGLALDRFHARPGETFAADTDAVTDRLAITENVVKERVRRIDNECAGRFSAGIIDDLPPETRIELCLVALFGRRGCRGLRGDLRREGEGRRRETRRLQYRMTARRRRSARQT